MPGRPRPFGRDFSASPAGVGGVAKGCGRSAQGQPSGNPFRRDRQALLVRELSPARRRHSAEIPEGSRGVGLPVPQAARRPLCPVGWRSGWDSQRDGGMGEVAEHRDTRSRGRWHRGAATSGVVSRGAVQPHSFRIVSPLWPDDVKGGHHCCGGLVAAMATMAARSQSSPAVAERDSCSGWLHTWAPDRPSSLAFQTMCIPPFRDRHCGGGPSAPVPVESPCLTLYGVRLSQGSLGAADAAGFPGPPA
jgi:hypothetical protein